MTADIDDHAELVLRAVALVRASRALRGRPRSDVGESEMGDVMALMPETEDEADKMIGILSAIILLLADLAGGRRGEDVLERIQERYVRIIRDDLGGAS